MSSLPTPESKSESNHFSTLSNYDVACIALQRTQHLMRVPWFGSPSYIGWRLGVSWPLRLESKWRRDSILNDAMEEIRLEFDELKDVLTGLPMEQVIDIGCGHAFIDLLFWQHFESRLTLVDIELSTNQHHGYQSFGAGYASLVSARTFLTCNGVPQANITTVNPNSQTLATEPQSTDLVLSLLSAGFHYPIRDYARIALQALKPGGVLVFDARSGTGQRNMLEGFAEIQVIKTFEKSERLAVFKR